jgi:hypothetical protein
MASRDEGSLTARMRFSNRCRAIGIDQRSLTQSGTPGREVGVDRGQAGQRSEGTSGRDHRRTERARAGLTPSRVSTSLRSSRDTGLLAKSDAPRAILDSRRPQDGRSPLRPRHEDDC